MSPAGGEQPVEGRADAQDAGASQDCKPLLLVPDPNTVTVSARTKPTTAAADDSLLISICLITRYQCRAPNTSNLCPNQRSEAANTNQTSSRGIHQDRTLDSNTSGFSSAPLGSTAEAFKWGAGDPMLQDATRHKYLEATQSNGIPRKFSGDQSAADSAFPSQLSTPSSRSLSPTRCILNPTSLMTALHFLF
jgi:hypothetical protein